MAFGATYRPAVILFFFLRQPVAATAIVGTWAFWEADRNFDLGVRNKFNLIRNTYLGFPTKESQYDAFKRIDAEKKTASLLKGASAAEDAE